MLQANEHGHPVGDLVRELHRQGCIAHSKAALTEIILDKWINGSHRFGMTVGDPLTAVDLIKMLWDSLAGKPERGWDRKFLEREVKRFVDAASEPSGK